MRTVLQFGNLDAFSSENTLCLGQELNLSPLFLLPLSLRVRLA